MSSPVVSYQTHSSVPVFALAGPVDSVVIDELHLRLSAAREDGQELIIIDLLGTPAMASRIASELGAALRNASRGVRLAVISADLRVQNALELAGIEALGFYPTLKAVD